MAADFLLELGDDDGLEEKAVALAKRENSVGSAIAANLLADSCPSRKQPGHVIVPVSIVPPRFQSSHSIPAVLSHVEHRRVCSTS